MPSTPQVRSAQPSDKLSPHTRPSDAPPSAEQDAARAEREELKARALSEPRYLIAGTGCLAGHNLGEELDAGRIGTVPSRKLARMGFGLAIWVFAGSLFLFQGRWSVFALLAIVLWPSLSAVVQRRIGHRGRCLRTRAWRHAWGGLMPAPSDPTRPAGT